MGDRKAPCPHILVTRGAPTPIRNTCEDMEDTISGFPVTSAMDLAAFLPKPTKAYRRKHGAAGGRRRSVGIAGGGPGLRY